MGTIRKRKLDDGSFSFQVDIRRKGQTICKTFKDEITAKLYEFYKEGLIDGMEAFEVPLESRVTLRHVFELKIDGTVTDDRKFRNDMKTTLIFFENYFGVDRFYSETTYKDWLACAEQMMNSDVYRGAKTEASKRNISIATVRKRFAHASATISYAKTKGIPLENHPMKVMQTYINPRLKDANV